MLRKLGKFAEKPGHGFGTARLCVCEVSFQLLLGSVTDCLWTGYAIGQHEAEALPREGGREGRPATQLAISKLIAYRDLT